MTIDFFRWAGPESPLQAHQLTGAESPHCSQGRGTLGEQGRSQTLQASRRASLTCPTLPRPVPRVSNSPLSLGSLTQHCCPSQLGKEQLARSGEGAGKAKGAPSRRPQDGVGERTGAVCWQRPGTRSLSLVTVECFLKARAGIRCYSFLEIQLSS